MRPRTRKTQGDAHHMRRTKKMRPHVKALCPSLATDKAEDGQQKDEEVHSVSSSSGSGDKRSSRENSPVNSNVNLNVKKPASSSKVLGSKSSGKKFKQTAIRSNPFEMAKNQAANKRLSSSVKQTPTKQVIDVELSDDNDDNDDERDMASEVSVSKESTHLTVSKSSSTVSSAKKAKLNREKKPSVSEKETKNHSLQGFQENIKEQETGDDTQPCSSRNVEPELIQPSMVDDELEELMNKTVAQLEGLSQNQRKALLDDVRSKSYGIKAKTRFKSIFEAQQELDRKECLLNSKDMLSLVKAAVSAGNEFEKTKRRKLPKNYREIDSDSDSDVQEIPEDEWEVEKIMDWMITPSGQELFRIKWKNWSGRDTWEPINNLENSVDAVKEFLDNKYPPDVNEREDVQLLFELRVILEQITSEEEKGGDIGLVIKLLDVHRPEPEKKSEYFGDIDDSDSDDDGDGDGDGEEKTADTKKTEVEVDPTEPLRPDYLDGTPKYLEFLSKLPVGMTPTFLRKNIDDLRSALKKRCRLILNYFLHDVKTYTAKQVIGVTCECLGINEKYGGLQQFLDYASKRKETQHKLEKLQEDINNRIDYLGDGPRIRVENLWDNVLPEKFVYIKEYDIHKSLEKVIDSDSFKVTCGCGEGQCDRKTCPCIKENASTPYNPHGTLMVDGRNPIYECNDSCGCGVSCRFKVVSKGRTFKLCIFRTKDGRGYGLKALENIPKKKFIVTYVGELISSGERDSRDKTQEEWKTTYMMDLDFHKSDGDGDEDDKLFAVDARRKGNLSRFINHSCDPNLCINPCWVETQDLRRPHIAFFSTRDIKRGEELFIDYNAVLQDLDADQLESQFSSQVITSCRCKSAKCRGSIF